MAFSLFKNFLDNAQRERDSVVNAFQKAASSVATAAKKVIKAPIDIITGGQPDTLKYFPGELKKNTILGIKKVPEIATNIGKSIISDVTGSVNTTKALQQTGAAPTFAQQPFVTLAQTAFPKTFPRPIDIQEKSQVELDKQRETALKLLDLAKTPNQRNALAKVIMQRQDDVIGTNKDIMGKTPLQYGGEVAATALLATPFGEVNALKGTGLATRLGRGAVAGAPFGVAQFMKRPTEELSGKNLAKDVALNSILGSVIEGVGPVLFKPIRINKKQIDTFANAAKTSQSVQNVLKNADDTVDPLIARDAMDDALLQLQAQFPKHPEARQAILNIEQLKNTNTPINNWSALNKNITNNINDTEVINSVNNHLNYRKMLAQDSVFVSSFKNKTVDDIDKLIEPFKEQIDNVINTTPPTNITPSDFTGAPIKLTEKIPGILEQALPIAKQKKDQFISNLRLDKLGLNEQSQDDLFRVIKENSDFIEQRRGVQTFEDTRKASEQIVLDLNRKLKPGTALNAEQLTKYGDALAGVTARLSDISKKIKAGDNSDKTLLEQAKLIQEQAVLSASFFGGRAETGRAMSIMRDINRALSPEILRDQTLIKKALDNAGGRETIENISQRLAEFGDDTIGKIKFVQKLNKPKFADYLDWYWYNSLLSGPKTQERNIIGTGSNIGFRIVSKPFAAGIDLFKTATSKVAGKNRTRQVYLGEFPSEVMGILKGIPEGVNKAIFMLRNGFSLDSTKNVTELAAPEVFQGFLPNAVSRTMKASDQFMKAISASSELNALAYKSAKSKGLKGNEFTKFVNDFIENPPESALAHIDEVSGIDTFTNQADKITNALSNITKNQTINVPKLGDVTIWNPLKMIVPFIRTVVNVQKRGFEATPFGLISGALKSNGRLSSQAQGKALLGTLVSLPLVMYASQGGISGMGPKNKNMRDALLKTGWKPNSVKVGNKWVSYQLFQPLNTQLAVIGNMHDAYVYDKEEINPGTIIGKLANTTLDSSFLSGLNDFLTGLSYGDISKTINQSATALAVPYSAAVRTLTQAIDPVVRDTSGDGNMIQSIKENIMATIPGVSQQLPARLDVFGDEIKREGGPLKRAFDPFNIGTELPQSNKDLQAVQLAQKLDIKIPEPEKKLKLKNPNTNTYEEVDRKTRLEYQKQLGEQSKAAFIDVMSTKEFQSLSDADKKDLLEMRLNETKQFINDTFLLGDKTDDRKRLQKLSLDLKTKEFYTNKNLDDIANNIVDVIRNGGNKQKILQDIKKINGDDEVKKLETKITNIITGGTEFEQFLKSKDTDVRAVFVMEKIKSMPQSEKKEFLSNLINKKILNDATMKKMLQIMTQEKLQNSSMPDVFKKAITPRK